MNIEELRQFAERSDDVGFWRVQFQEHADLIALTLVPSEQQTAEVRKDLHRMQHEAKEWSKRWKHLRKDAVADALKPFCDFKRSVRDFVLRAPTWVGWAPATLYQHMILECEYLSNVLRAPEDRPRLTLALWLTDLLGHATLDAAWIDPAHADLVAKARNFQDGLAALKLTLGLPPWQDLANLQDAKSEFMEQLNDLTHPGLGDRRETLSKLFIVTAALSAFHVELLKGIELRRVQVTMPIDFVRHSLKECFRAERDLRELL